MAVGPGRGRADLRPQIDSSAGTSVTAAAMATTTTPMPPYATDRNPPVRNSSPESDAVTVSPENTMVRPAVATVRSMASATSSPRARSSRNRLIASSE